MVDVDRVVVTLVRVLRVMVATAYPRTLMLSTSSMPGWQPPKDLKKSFL
jgi:hypothetical protein